MEPPGNPRVPSVLQSGIGTSRLETISITLQLPSMQRSREKSIWYELMLSILSMEKLCREINEDRIKRCVKICKGIFHVSSAMNIKL